MTLKEFISRNRELFNMPDALKVILNNLVNFSLEWEDTIKLVIMICLKTQFPIHWKFNEQDGVYFYYVDGQLITTTLIGKNESPARALARYLKRPDWEKDLESLLYHAG